MPAAPASGLARVRTCGLWGLDVEFVTVEVDVAAGLPQLQLVGLPDASVREARDRVRAAIRNSGFEFPLRRVTVNLAPVERRKEGSGFDLAIAVGILGATGQLPGTDGTPLLLGELGLDGAVRALPGCLPRVARAVDAGVCDVIVPSQNAGEAAAVEGARVHGAASLREVVSHLLGEDTLPLARRSDARSGPRPSEVDLADISGQESGKRALEIAVAGGHNILLVGPPGTGKTLLAKALPALLPAFTPREQFEASVIHSVAGLLGRDAPLLAHRPYRSPHHTLSAVALVGGASPPRPGEVSLAHRGALFLDELSEYRPAALEALREPLEEGRITISRAGASATFPARTLLAAAMNPCPCGFNGDPDRECRCIPDQVSRYRGRISGPFLDRIDMRVWVPRVAPTEMRHVGGERSETVLARIESARERMRGRGVPSNAELPLSELRRSCRLSTQAESLLERAVARDRLSPRGYHRVIRVARTIADLAGVPDIASGHLAEAIALHRPL